MRVEIDGERDLRSESEARRTCTAKSEKAARHLSQVEPLRVN